MMQIAVARATNAIGQVLLVRKKGTVAFMQPGGKIECGEEAMTALIRELDEELGLRVEASNLSYLGQASAPAANEPGFVVEASIYALQVSDPVTVGAELEEAVWIDPADPGALVLAPLTRDCVLPLAVPVR